MNGGFAICFFRFFLSIFILIGEFHASGTSTQKARDYALDTVPEIYPITEEGVSSNGFRLENNSIEIRESSSAIHGRESSNNSENQELSCSDVMNEPSSKRCNLSKLYCSSEGLIDYYQLYYCQSKEEIHVCLLIFFIIAMILLFYLLGLFAESFFCPSLAFISEKLSLSPDVAGVTLLAFGNGAPDVFSTLAGISSNNFEMALGELLGAGLFITTVIVGSVSVVSSCSLEKYPFVRDVAFFMVGLAALFTITRDEKVYLFESILLLLFYILYALFTVAAQFYLARNEKTTNPTIPTLRPLLFEHESSNFLGRRTPFSQSGNSWRRIYLSKVGIYDQLKVYTIQHDHREYSQEAAEVNTLANDSYSSRTSWWYPFLHYIRMKAKWHKRRLYQRVFFVLMFPARVVFDLTTPTTKKKHWNRYIATLHPLLSPLVVLLALRGFYWHLGPISIWMVIECCGLLLSIVVWLTTNHESPPKYMSAFIALSFLMSIVWMFLIAQEIIALLEILGIIIHLSQAILGVTILAWGNSISGMSSICTVI